MTRDDPSRVKAILDDIRRFGVTAARVVTRGRERFFDPEDDDQRRIAKSVVIDLSTAAERLPASFRDAHDDVDWAGIRATRNFIAHDYTGTDDELLWRAITVEFPKILAKLGL
ncbi:DUF86 domain-containing protein [Agromyces albus]|uniref:DUF86 domain-containing protein n=1 Tax=Agromyces albus TaxID=205332 RepID=A0A4Q2KU48_9MICO|nr:HepT-like ribonuclease domain-containing protein [Agromyces albus]RXZ68307.1 DUF86 domain-containing protein [Agromyces albus]